MCRRETRVTFNYTSNPMNMAVTGVQGSSYVSQTLQPVLCPPLLWVGVFSNDDEVFQCFSPRNRKVARMGRLVYEFGVCVFVSQHMTVAGRLVAPVAVSLSKDWL